MLTVAVWWWGTKYPQADIWKLKRSVRRHLEQPHRFIAITDQDIEVNGVQHNHLIAEADRPLLATPGCFARLRMFDPNWQAEIRVEDRLVCMDLDTVITGPLDPLFNRAETFMILQGANAANHCPFNGSLMMLRAGAHPEVWSEFSIDKAKQIPFYEFPDDQGWLHHKLPNASGWKVGSPSGVYAFQKPGWPKGDDLPKDASMVVFPGWRSPEKFKHLPWVQKHWQ